MCLDCCRKPRRAAGRREWLMDKTATAIPDDPVAGLIDIPLPTAVSLWPQTWTSRIAVALLVIGLIAAIIFLVRRWHANRYRRAALAELDHVLRSASEKDALSTADALALLVRRTALAIFPRETIAPLSGAAWLDFFDRRYDGEEFFEWRGGRLGLAIFLAVY